MTVKGAGDLMEQVALDQPIETPDGGGGTETTWTPVGQYFAKVEPVGRASEVLRGLSLEAPVTHRVTMRYLTGPTPRWRARWLQPDGSSIIMNIRAVTNPDLRKRWTELWCDTETPT